MQSRGLSAGLAVRLARSSQRARDAVAEKTWGGWWRHRVRPAAEKLLERPSSSTWLGVLVHGLILTLIFLSTVCFCMETLPQYQKGWKGFWMWTEIFFVTAFGIEYLIRIAVTSKPLSEFVSEPLNVCDLLSFLPSLLLLVLPLASFGTVGPVNPLDPTAALNPASTTYHLLTDLRILRVFRLTRVFKFGKYSEDMQYIFEGLTGSRTSFLLLALLLGLAMVFFSFLLFMLEQGTYDKKKGCFAREGESHFSGCSPYKDVPTGLYWAITTITTVGYGETFPITVPGKLVAGCCQICGILCVALPTTVLGVEFANLFDINRINRERTAGRKSMTDLNKTELEFLGIVKKFSIVKNTLKRKFPHLRQLGETCKMDATDSTTLRILTKDLVEKMESYEKFLKTHIKRGRMEAVLTTMMEG